ncbi:NADPH dehydrogenase NamA [Amphibacillus cookii]|uniref:NADPH dehydrogenase NamA n=1 Tax=Amphibacillus cookii TaxID=767787 RepID=UPI00195E7169|nr:NADPH dehydrogenase NamA [Amphibacillus cookii]MBM7542463.1 NADPH2 dehydrogenase [Amphibacillus cookii]
MTVKLFDPISFRDVTLKNRIVMAPMCMYAVEQQDGMVTPFHTTHYETRAVGQTGLIIVEATAVQPEGRISLNDLGIWSDEHISGLNYLNKRIHAHQAKSCIQLGHAGRKASTNMAAMAPSVGAIDHHDDHTVAMTAKDIEQTIDAFRLGALRAKQAGFDVIEIHAAHGYLINQFLSPLTNQRNDKYGGNRDNRYRLLEEVIEAIQLVWNGPLFVRISADEYHKNGNQRDDMIYFSQKMKKQGIDLVDVSTGGVIQTDIDVYPGYQIPQAEVIKQRVNIPTAAVGLITEAEQAEEILKNKRADLVCLARVLLREPYWPHQAAVKLGYNLEAPLSYKRGWLT